MKCLYLAVRGLDANQQWPNDWDEKTGVLKQITTSAGVVNHCKEALESKEWVYIHRTGKGYSTPMIIAKVKISFAEGDVVKFSNWSSLNLTPPRRFRGGKCYFDEPVDGDKKKVA